jgi:hypothetical protein
MTENKVRYSTTADIIADMRREIERRDAEADDAALALAQAGWWVPCSERLPIHGQKVLVTIDLSEVSSIRPNYVDCAIWDQHGYFSSRGIDWRPTEILAWRPLPPPYDPETL